MTTRVEHGGAMPSCLYVTHEPDVERREHEDDADVRCQPLPDVAAEEQDIDADDDSCHRDHVEHARERSSHEPSLLGRRLPSVCRRGMG